MYENLVHQNVSVSLKSDIAKNKLPGALLFAGPESCGKLTAALETARILSCRSDVKGKWTCTCNSCLQHKALTCTNLMLLGPRDCFLEILSSKQTFISAYEQNAPFLDAARYLFLRSIRKLTLRFNPFLWEDSSNLSKIATLIEKINEMLEQLDFPRTLPALEETKKLCEKLVEQCKKLESDYLYDSIPVNQIRKMEQWAHIKSEDGKKTIIIENADRMLPGVRNALLKILEEPPADCVFILLTSKRNAIMQTILSRVRTYNFNVRTLEQQKEVVARVYHNGSFSGALNDYLLTFLPVPPEQIRKQAQIFFTSIAQKSIPDCAAIVKACADFKPRIELKLFLNYLAVFQQDLRSTACGCEVSAKCMDLFRQCWDNVTMYNQTPVSALEILLRDMAGLNVTNGNIFGSINCVDM